MKIIEWVIIYNFFFFFLVYIIYYIRFNTCVKKKNQEEAYFLKYEMSIVNAKFDVLFRTPKQGNSVS